MTARVEAATAGSEGVFLCDRCPVVAESVTGEFADKTRRMVILGNTIKLVVLL
jgi:hypothetical protein